MNNPNQRKEARNAFSPTAYREKIVNPSQLLEDVQAARKSGRRVILTNGCFDVLHVGHIRYLQAAKDLDGILVVGVNSDDSVRELKGSGRPILPQEQRVELVAALRCVDKVVIFNQPNVAGLIALLHPDIHAKGTEYTTDNVPERNQVLQYGGQVCIVGDPKDHSTRDLISLVRSKCRR